jgi:hypothetical protein
LALFSGRKPFHKQEAGMFHNATTVHLRPGKVDQALQILRTYCIPVMKAQRGFINIALVPDSFHHRITVISLWQTHTHALAVEARCGYMHGMRLLAPLLASPIPQAAGDVSTQFFAVN